MWLFLFYSNLGLVTVIVTLIADNGIDFDSSLLFSVFLYLLVLAILLVQSWLI